MFGFLKRKPIDCPEGSVHAYEYRGKLYATVAERDAAIRLDKIRRLKNGIRIALCDSRTSLAHPHRPMTRDTRQQVEYFMEHRDSVLGCDKRYTSDNLIEVLVRDWDYIKEHVECLRKELNIHERDLTAIYK